MVKRPSIALAIAVIAVLAVAGVAAANDGSGPQRDRERATDRSEIPELLGLTWAEIEQLRHEDGLSLAQIAERQGVAPDLVIEQLMARWEERIRAREERGALSEAEATRLRTELEVRVRDIVYRAIPGGMGGQAVGAGYGAGNGTGDGAGYRAGNGTGEPVHEPGTGGGAGQGPAWAGGSDESGAGAHRGARDGSGPIGNGRP